MGLNLIGLLFLLNEELPLAPPSADMTNGVAVQVSLAIGFRGELRLIRSLAINQDATAELARASHTERLSQATFPVA